MKDLTREQIAVIVEHGFTQAAEADSLCSMALRTLDAEAECARLREEANETAGELHRLAKELGLPDDGPQENVDGALQVIARLRAEALQVIARLRAEIEKRDARLIGVVQGIIYKYAEVDNTLPHRGNFSAMMDEIRALLPTPAEPGAGEREAYLLDDYGICPRCERPLCGYVTVGCQQCDEPAKQPTTDARQGALEDLNRLTGGLAFERPLTDLEHESAQRLKRALSDRGDQGVVEGRDEALEELDNLYEVGRLIAKANSLLPSHSCRKVRRALATRAQAEQRAEEAEHYRDKFQDGLKLANKMCDRRGDRIRQRMCLLL